MIAQLRGVVLEKHPNQVVLDAGGVGYDVAIPISTYSALPDVGATATLRIHTHVREDALQLFGFFTPNEKTIFEKLIGVSGIGPKLALTVLSGLPIEEFVAAVRQSQVEVLVKIPGIGKKTAERLVLELRDKLDLIGVAVPEKGAPAKPKSTFSPEEEDVISALVNMGSPRANAETALQKAKAQGAGDEFEALFRKALTLLR